jgi:hypothetical protein
MGEPGRPLLAPLRPLSLARRAQVVEAGPVRQLERHRSRDTAWSDAVDSAAGMAAWPSDALPTDNGTLRRLYPRMQEARATLSECCPSDYRLRCMDVKRQPLAVMAFWCPGGQLWTRPGITELTLSLDRNFDLRFGP